MVTERQGTDADVARRILSHPVRVAILETLLRQGIISASVSVRKSGASLGVASHHTSRHTRCLAERRVIPLGSCTQARGSVRHYVPADTEISSAVLGAPRASRYPQRAITAGRVGVQQLLAVLRSLRERTNITPADVAARAGLSVSYLAKIERDQADPRVADVSAIAKALGSSLERVVSEVDHHA
jgi:DNA-binding phage protein